jgi:hypothetical protein
MQSEKQSQKLADLDHEFSEESLLGNPSPFALSSTVLLLTINEMFVTPAVTGNLYFLPVPTGPPIKRLLAPIPARGPPVVSQV